jgi:hypothetical protein
VGGQPEHDAATYGLFELRLILLREGSAFVRVRSRSLRGEKGLRIEFLSERRRTAANARQPCHSEGRGFESHHPLQESPRERGLFRCRSSPGKATMVSFSAQMVELSFSDTSPTAISTAGAGKRRFGPGPGDGKRHGVRLASRPR